MVDCGLEFFVFGIDVGIILIKVFLLWNNIRDVVESFSCEIGVNICVEVLDFVE